MAYVSVIAKLNEKLNTIARNIADGIDRYNVNVGEYPTCEMICYEQLKNKKKKILNKLGEITWQKCHDLEDEAGYYIGSEYAITVNGKTHKHLFGENTTLPNGQIIGWQTIEQKVPTYRV